MDAVLFHSARLPQQHSATAAAANEQYRGVAKAPQTGAPVECSLLLAANRFLQRPGQRFSPLQRGMRISGVAKRPRFAGRLH